MPHNPRLCRPLQNGGAITPDISLSAPRTVDSFRSLVVPAIGVTIARFRVASRLYRVDLPTFGLPTMTTRNAPPRAGALSGGRFIRLRRNPPLSSSAAGLLLLRGRRGLPPPAGFCVLSARACCGCRAVGGGVAVVAGCTRPATQERVLCVGVRRDLFAASLAEQAMVAHHSPTILPASPQIYDVLIAAREHVSLPSSPVCPHKLHNATCIIRG